MTKIIAVTNQKGGVGKTTTCVNLAASMAATQQKVLVIDLDPQGNATMASGIDKYQVTHTSYDLLMEQINLDEIILTQTTGNFHLIPSNSDVTAAEINLIDIDSREEQLKKALSKIKDRYDYIFIDCPPALNLLTINAMTASDSVLVPMQCEYFALEGLTSLMDTIEKIKNSVNEHLELEGILRTMFDPRNRLANDVSDQLKKYFNEKVYRTVIPRNVRLAEAPSHGKPILYYDKFSSGAKAYLALAGEVLRQHTTVEK